jgi:transketolase
MRSAFVRALVSEAKENKNIELLTGDLGFGVLQPYVDNVPQQFTNCGIAEANMTSMAAGMALRGKTVITYSIGNFPTLRCLEQIRNDCAYMHANVKIVCVGCGFAYGQLGMSHHATEDISIMRALPGVTFFSPCDAYEADTCTHMMLKTPGACYLRLGRDGGPKLHNEPTTESDILNGSFLSEGSKTVIIGTGPILSEALEAKKMIKEKGLNPAIFSIPLLKPLSQTTIEKLAKDFDTFITIEDNQLSGGFGSAIGESILSLVGQKPRLIRLAIQDQYCSVVGDEAYLRHYYGIDKEAIEKTLESL